MRNSVVEVGERIRSLLPADWFAEMDEDGCLLVRSPDDESVAFSLQTRRKVEPREVAGLVSASSAHTLVVAPFLSPRTRELLADVGISFADSTGNVRLVASRPGLFVSATGADRDPNRQPRALRSLKGTTSGRVVRALCEFRPPHGVRELAELANTPLGTVSRVVSFLEEEALLSRDGRKKVTEVDWPALLRRWAADYSVRGSNQVRSCLAPRGLGVLLGRLAGAGKYAITGAAAGPAIAPPRLVMIYVEDVAAGERELELVPAESGANVWLLEPYDHVVFARTQDQKLVSFPDVPSVTTAAPSQVAVDLLTSPGRGPEQGEALIEQMQEDEDAWRQPARS